MENRALFRDIVKAAALGDLEKAERLDDEIPDVQREQFTTYLTAMFCGAIEHRFKDDQSREAVVRFVEEMRYDYRDAEPAIRPFVIEGVIRGVLGEEHLLEEISPQDQLLYQIPVIRKIVAQSPQMQERIDEYLTDAETLAAEWASEDD